MTSGGERVTSGGERRARRTALLAFAAIGLGFATVNALSEFEERRRMGQPVHAWEPWVWELTSLAGLLLLAPLVFHLSDKLRPPLLRWRAAIPLLALLSVPFSIAHVGIMVVLRDAIYRALGQSYRASGGLLDVLAYEYRKDLLTYGLLLLLPYLAARVLERPTAQTPGRFRLQVRDGSRTVWLSPTEIDWAQAAGNYVELHGSFGTLLHRRTLAAIEAELRPYGFVRIHRSRIVRTAAVARVETKPTGDFDAVTVSGDAITGSRRYRANLAQNQ